MIQRLLARASGGRGAAALGMALWLAGCSPAPRPAETATNGPTATNATGSAKSAPLALPSPAEKGETGIRAASTPAGAEPAEQENAADLINLGNQRLAEGRFDEALELFKKALKQNAEDENTHYNLGITYARLGKKEEAAKSYLEALRLYPDYTEAHNNLGNLYLGEKKFDLAIEHFQAAIKTNPEHAMSRNNLGTALSQTGKLNEAVLEFSKAIELNPNYLEAEVNLGNAYLQQGRAEESAREFTKALKLNPQFQPALRGLTRARQKLQMGAPPSR